MKRTKAPSETEEDDYERSSMPGSGSGSGFGSGCSHSSGSGSGQVHVSTNVINKEKILKEGGQKIHLNFEHELKSNDSRTVLKYSKPTVGTNSHCMKKLILVSGTPVVITVDLLYDYMTEESQSNSNFMSANGNDHQLFEVNRTCGLMPLPIENVKGKGKTPPKVRVSTTSTNIQDSEFEMKILQHETEIII